ncbi:hypothetical protein ES708_16969 [subsurface metagenome]
MPDHLHILLGLKPSESIYDLLREIKKSSTNYIDKNRFVRGKFGWQKGYGAFSYIQTQLDTIYKYIANQKEHHKRRSFREEYLDLLRSYNVDYNSKYLSQFNE